MTVRRLRAEPRVRQTFSGSFGRTQRRRKENFTAGGRGERCLGKGIFCCSVSLSFDEAFETNFIHLSVFRVYRRVGREWARICEQFHNDDPFGIFTSLFMEMCCAAFLDSSQPQLTFHNTSMMKGKPRVGGDSTRT